MTFPKVNLKMKMKNISQQKNKKVFKNHDYYHYIFFQKLKTNYFCI